MAQFVLEILDGDRAGEVVSLAATLRIGRKPANDLVLADEKTSGVHAEIVPEGDSFVLRDLGSTNGTFLDGRRVTEVVLSPGDAFLIGRVKLRFRADGEAGAGAGAGDDSMSLGRLDKTRLSAAKPKSSVALLLVLLVLAAGAGGYVWWRNNQPGGENIVAAGHGHKPPMVVADNRLLDAGNCESDQGWDLKLAGAAFQTTARSHTGSGAFEAVAGASTNTGAGEPDFAVATTSVAVTVPANHAVQLAAHVRTEGGARIAARLHFSSSNEAMPFQFRSGTPLAEAADWQRIAVTLAVPPSADRCQVEIVAALPKGSSAAFDDVAVTDATGAEAVQKKPEEAAATLIGTGSSVAIRSEPPTMLALLPGSAPPGLGGLLEASQLVLSDLGAKVAVDGDPKGLTLQVEGCDALQLVFPADSAGALLAQGEQGFGAVAVPGEFTTDALLLGERTSRCLVTLPSRVAVRAARGKGECRLTVPCARVQFQLGFRKERTDAQEALRAARGEAQQGQPGKALDLLRELARKWPHDVETLVQASEKRDELQAVVAEKLRAIGADLDEAEFFSTRGGFERAVRDIDEVRQTYGEQNLPDPQAVAAMQKRAADRLQQIDGQRAADEKQRLLQMATCFEQAQKTDLAKLVKDYVQQHLGNLGN
jgi:hypothetical protein